MLNAVLLVVLVIGLICLKGYAEKRSEERYDERQLLLQKKAYAQAAWVSMIFNVMISLGGRALERYVSLSFIGVVNLFLVVLIFVSSSILNDAYFTKMKRKSFLYFYLFIIAIQLFAAYRQWSKGNFIQSGHLYLTAENATSLLFVVTFVPILLVTGYKIWRDKNEVDS